MRERYLKEVNELHDFFVAWFRGETEETDAAFERVSSVLTPSFLLVSPRGVADDRDAILASIREAYGRRGAAFRIWIDGFQLRFHDRGLGVVTYQEWQEDEGEPATGRISTALLREHAHAGPNGVSWLHVHETWLPASS